MTASGHTPGPWRVGPVDDTVVTHVGADGVRYEIAAIDGDYNEPDLWPIMEANARLIAAAPDLLEALEELCERYDTIGGEPFEHPEDSPWFKARAALSKARGGEGHD